MNAMRIFELELIFLICLCISCSKPAIPESAFRTWFSDLSTGIPDYQTFIGFTHPEDALKGDACTADFNQSDAQFVAFASHLGISPTSILSSNGVWVVAQSKLNPKYPWMLIVHANVTNAPAKIYQVHIDGQQPYN